MNKTQVFLYDAWGLVGRQFDAAVQHQCLVKAAHLATRFTIIVL
jgi:hypothetical protein